ncbi:MAG: ArsA family ATPase [Actinobacteria bacterium]|nr:ArsA family ATPase [Actinomycetota bacterium]
MTEPATRVLLFTGKGGVGKTSVAAATALRCADAGLRTIVISTDPAHSLADAFDTVLGPVAAPVEGHEFLWGEQFDAQDRMEESWADIRSYLLEVFDWAGLEGIRAEELSMLPGLEEVFALSDINTYVASGDWDVVVVDCAPTAETIRLLSLPEILAWYMERVFPVGRRVNRLVGPVLSKVSNLPVADDAVFGAGRRFYDRLDGVREVLADPEVTSIRLVVNPEKMVIAEARRTYTYLSLFGYRVDAVIANRLLPEAIKDPWFERWKTLQAEHLAEIEAGFAPLPILRASLADHELVGSERLRGLGDEIYVDLEAHRLLHRDDPLGVDVNPDGTATLRLPLPFASGDDLDLSRSGDELSIRIGSYRRVVSLPDALRRRPVASARLNGGVLEIGFGCRTDQRRPRGGSRSVAREARR